MKLKFEKAYLSFKKDAIEVIEDAEVAADLIAKGYATEVKEEATVESIVAQLKAEVEAVAKETAKAAAAETIKEVNKAFAGRKPTITVGPDNVSLDPQKGFKSYGEFAQTVAKATTGDENARRKAAAGQSEGTNADGGYSVPTIWADQIYQDIFSESDLLPRTQQYHLTVGDILNIPADDTSTLGTSGITASWTLEGGTISVTKAALRQVQLQPYKLSSLVAVTSELLADNSANLETYLNDKAGYALNYAINNAIVRGSGSSRPTGIIGHASTVRQARTTASTVVFADVANMYARFYGKDKNAVWLVNPEVWSKLAQMTSGNFNIFLSNNAISGLPTMSMFGIPVLKCEHSSTLGNTGDAVLADMSAYLTCLKGGVDTASSMHLYFNSDQMAFRYQIRLDGKPARSTTITPASGQGSSTRSPFVELDSSTTTPTD